VSDYRVYFIGRDGHFLRAIDIQVASDQDAIARALELREGHEVEVWEHTRFVRRLTDPTSSSDDPAGAVGATNFEHRVPHPPVGAFRGRHWRSHSEFPLVEAARVPRRAIPILRSRIELSKDFGRERQRSGRP
jgi:hypothetical protein